MNAEQFMWRNMIINQTDGKHNQTDGKFYWNFILMVDK